MVMKMVSHQWKGAQTNDIKAMLTKKGHEFPYPASNVKELSTLSLYFL